MATSIVDVHQLEKLRPLGPLEQFSSSRHHLGFYNNVGISTSYTSPIQDPCALKQTILSALASVIARHPILSAIPIDEDSTSPYFARLTTLNLLDTVTFLSRKNPLRENQTDDELDRVLEEQHNISFKARYGALPFWRLIVLANPSCSETETSFTAAFIFHHSLGDGGSGLIFHKDFFAALSSNPSPLPNTIILTPNIPLVPNLETLLPLSAPPGPVNAPPKVWSGAPITLPLKSNFRSLPLSASTTARFLAACRANKTTLTASLPIIITSALSSLLPSHHQNFETTIPVSLRRFLPGAFKDNEEIGCFIDAFSQFHPRSSISSGFTWDEARRSKSLIDSYLSSAGAKTNVAKFRCIPDMCAFFASRVGKERGSSFDVSNLGVLAPTRGQKGEALHGDGEGWKMGRTVFSRSMFVAGSAFSTGVVTGADGCLVLGFVWQEGVVEGLVMEGVIEYVRMEIERIARE